MSVYNSRLGELVAKHPLNNSTAKAQYSFPRAKRFFEAKPSNCEAGFYDLPNFRHTRSASFGFGKKTDFTEVHRLSNPGPTQYSLESPFDNPGRKRNSITFGSRPATGGIIGNTTALSNPGPGAYSPKLFSNSRSFSLVEINDERKNQLMPAPNVYTLQAAITSSGFHFNSKWKSSAAGVISPNNSQRFNPKAYVTEAPGPGTYDLDNLKSKGSYILSKFPNLKGIKFARSASKNESFSNLLQKDTPGPGSYILPSDFGSYVSPKVLNATTTSFTVKNRPSVSGGSNRPRTSTSSKRLHGLLNSTKGNVFESAHKKDTSTNHSNMSADKGIEKTQGTSFNLEENHDTHVMKDPVKEEDPVAETTQRAK